MAEIDQQFVRDRFYYNPQTGDLIHRKRPESMFKSAANCATWNKKNAGNAVSAVLKTKNGKRYRVMSLDGKTLTAHRIIWLYVHGEFPKYQIDHIDGNGLNNKLSNLREVTQSINSQNQRLRTDNKSGLPGVARYSKAKWVSYINDNKERTVLLTTDDFFEACCARKSAENRIGYHVNHGQKRPLAV